MFSDETRLESDENSIKSTQNTIKKELLYEWYLALGGSAGLAVVCFVLILVTSLTCRRPKHQRRQVEQQMEQQREMELQMEQQRETEQKMAEQYRETEQMKVEMAEVHRALFQMGYTSTTETPPPGDELV